MDRHTSLIQLGIDLGYFKKDAGGICMGVTSAWIEACFCHDEAAFNQRVNKFNRLALHE